ncbi:MAG: undecaprenyl-diphosphate phosphatase [Peptoniphilaceae bacterium]|nr:undecaprenyl-diphosphate phosphatase [Peptoniphilaceae bacterium]MDY5765392.1 undecaprenyl-diphosphate phosphatase [Peptoniphilaceae bacterium]
MNGIIDFFKVAVLSIVEGITEFLPISSTGHLILVNEFVKLSPKEFANAFSYIIQLGAILSVVVIYFHRLNPWKGPDHGGRKLPDRYAGWNRQTRIYYRISHPDGTTMDLWKKVIIGCIPGAVFGLALDDLIDAHLMTVPVVTTTLIVYGIIMIWMENRNAKRSLVKYESTAEVPYRIAFFIGLFQCLALIPGTSRSAATIIGAMALGASRMAAAEFSFFMAIPVMVGATGLKVVKNLGNYTAGQWMLILAGFVISFLVAYAVIQKFLSYIQKKDFKIFGYYRIALGLALIIYMIFSM